MKEQCSMPEIQKKSLANELTFVITSKTASGPLYFHIVPNVVGPRETKVH